MTNTELMELRRLAIAKDDAKKLYRRPYGTELAGMPGITDLSSQSGISHGAGYKTKEQKEIFIDEHVMGWMSAPQTDRPYCARRVKVQLATAETRHTQSYSCNGTTDDPCSAVCTFPCTWSEVISTTDATQLQRAVLPTVNPRVEFVGSAQPFYVLPAPTPSHFKINGPASKEPKGVQRVSSDLFVVPMVRTAEPRVSLSDIDAWIENTANPRTTETTPTGDVILVQNKSWREEGFAESYDSQGRLSFIHKPRKEIKPEVQFVAGNREFWVHKTTCAKKGVNPWEADTTVRTFPDTAVRSSLYIKEITAQHLEYRPHWCQSEKSALEGFLEPVETTQYKSPVFTVVSVKHDSKRVRRFQRADDHNVDRAVKITLKDDSKWLFRPSEIHYTYPQTGGGFDQASRVFIMLMQQGNVLEKPLYLPKKNAWVARFSDPQLPQRTLSYKENGVGRIRDLNHRERGLSCSEYNSKLEVSYREKTARSRVLTWTQALTHCNLTVRKLLRDLYEAQLNGWEKKVEQLTKKCEQWRSTAVICELAGGTVAKEFELESPNCDEALGKSKVRYSPLCDINVGTEEDAHTYTIPEPEEDAYAVLGDAEKELDETEVLEVDHTQEDTWRLS